MSFEHVERPCSEMTVRQAHITTISLAWSYFFPWVQPPTLTHMCTWLSMVSNKITTILDEMEILQQRTEADEEVEDVEYALYRQLRKYDTRPRSYRPAARAA